MNNIEDNKYPSGYLRQRYASATLTAIASLSIPGITLPVAAQNSLKSYHGVSRNHAQCLQTYNGKEINGHKVEVKGKDSGEINITKHIIIPLTVELTYGYDFTKNTLNVKIINSPIAYDRVWQEANKMVDKCR